MTKTQFGENASVFNKKPNAVLMAKVAFAGAAIALGCAAVFAATTANAQARPSYANQFQQPYGSSSFEMMTPYDAATRDLNANRVVVDGVITNGYDYSSGLLGASTQGTGVGYSGVTGYAIGNQLNVTTNGSYNSVVVNSSQVNNGNQTVIINGASTCQTTASCSTIQADSSQILNGGLNF